MNLQNRGILIIAWGNRGRRDDGVGLVLAEQLEALYGQDDRVTVVAQHQLGPELVEELHSAQLTIFIDAHCRTEADDVLLELVEPDDRDGLDTHHCRPGQLLALAKCLGYHVPLAVQIGIVARDMQFGEGLSAATEAAMNAARERIVDLIEASHPDRSPRPTLSQHVLC